MAFTVRIDDAANQQQSLIYRVKKLLVARNYQAVNIQIDTLLVHLVIDVAGLKTYERRQPSFKDLQYQTSNIA